MAICEVCGQEMNTAPSCEATTIDIGGEEYHLIPYGQETRLDRIAITPRCRDCGTLAGGFHHPGCDVAECPRCHGQLISCDCLGECDEDG